MVLSRIWYAILAFLLAGAYYSVSLAVGQYNRRNAAAMDETLKADSQVVGWSLQVDARRRLDSLLLASVDSGVVKALKGANGQNDIPSSAKEEGRKALSSFNEKMRPEYKADAVFAVDREGRLVSQIGYDASQKNPQFEMGGYPAVFDALHGYLRDDTWVLGGRIARVVARPVEDEVGQPPLGAVVALKWVDSALAKEVAKRTRTNVAFFAGGQVSAVAASTDGIDDGALQMIGDDLSKVVPDQAFQDTGRTDVRSLGGTTPGASIFVKLPGDAWKLGAGFAVVRPKVAISSAMGFLSGADDTDKKNVSFLVMFLILVLGAIGIAFTFLEVSRPMNEMVKQAEQLRAGGIDALQVARFRGAFRGIGQSLNAGIERVVEKGGGTARKPADLQAILGPVPAQPAMSAFSFPQNPPGAPPPPSSRGALPRPPISNLSGPPTSPPLLRPKAPSVHNDEIDTLAGSANAGTAMKAISGGIAGMPPAQDTLKHGFPVEDDEDDEDVATKVAQAPSEILGAGHDPEAAEWVGVYDDFIQTKRRCGEPTESLTFEKFQQTLRKNRDALIERHGCKRVKFTVYVKDGRASLKATPVRE